MPYMTNFIYKLYNKWKFNSIYYILYCSCNQWNNILNNRIFIRKFIY